ncbi:proline-rich receptor-like protein kinase PERK3 [Carex rostrata]
MPMSGRTDNTANQAYNTQSSDSSTQSSGFTSRTLSTPSPKSNQKRKKRMSDVILLCIGLGSGEKVRNLPSPMLDAVLNKKASLEVISGNVRFIWDEILRATGWFAMDLIVGEGGSSIVYRGKLDNSEDVAVKRAKKVNLIMKFTFLSLLFSFNTAILIFGSHLIKQDNYI